MRVVSGKARGIKLETLSGTDVVRPTTDIVKEAIFSSVQFLIEGRKFLDLYAGSGQMGIEALSRGAESATFVDSNRESIRIIKKNLNTVKLSDKAKVVQADAVNFVGNLVCSREKFDLVFLDPPYESDLIDRVISDVTEITLDTGRIICETSLKKEMPEKINDFIKYKVYRYGKIAVTVYIHKDMKE